MKRKLALVCALLLAVSVLLSGCGKTADSDVVKVGASTTPHAEILRQVVDAMAEKGYDLQIVEYTDYVQPNTAVEQGDLLANYFQHQPYLDTFNATNGTHIVSVAKIHYEPFGIYAGKLSSLAEAYDGMKIAVPNDGSNETRALLLLQQEGLITLKAGIDASSNATKLDVAENPYNIEIIEMEAAQIAHSLQDVDFGVINGNYALQAGLNAGADALAIEDASGDAAQTYANVLCVKEGNENDPGILALIECLTTPEMAQWITETYQGAVVPSF